MVRVLTALVLAASPGREEPTLDWAAIARNTAAWEAQQRTLEAQARTNGFDAELERRFSQAADTDDRAVASDNLQDALALLLRRRGQVELTFKQAETLLATLPNNEPLRARLETERTRYRTRQERISLKLRDAIAGFASDRSWPEVLVGGVRNALGQGERAAVRELRDELNAWQPRRPILGASTLNYVRGELTPAPLPTTQTTPAYLQAAAAGPALEDTTTGREVELSPDIVAQANALDTPLAIVEFVRNQCQLDWYLGNLKGSTETLRERRGNDADLSVLLVALLRARNVPARFINGTIELPIEKLADLMGMLSAAEHDAATPMTLDATRRNRVLQALSAAGIPFTLVQSGGQTSAVRLTHVWVEAWLPYADYRGVGTSLEGKQWVPIEPAISGGAKYALNAPAFDPFGSFTARALTDAALTDVSTRSPLESYRDTVRAWLATAHPGVTYESTLRSVTPRLEELDVIPGSLPYTVVSVQSETAFLADSLKHRVRLALSDANGALLDVTLPLHRLVGHRSSLMFDPATDADRALLAASGLGLYGAPATLLEVAGVVRLDGVEAARTTRAVPLGVTLAWTAELLLPNGTSRRIDNEVISGTSIALGFAAPFNRHVERAAPPAADLDGPAQRFLYGRVAAYANEWTAAEEELAALTGVSLIRPTANVAFVQNQLHVVTTLGVRQRVEFRGVEIDADLRTAVPLELTAGRAGELLELSGHQGSFLEAKVLADGTGERAISATEVIREAGRRGLTVLRIDASNSASQLPLLTADAEVLRDVTDQVALGREVLIPSAVMAIENWEGSGYITREPSTREAGYLLSGIVSGGTTVVSPRFWQDRQLVAQLLSPTARPATSDLTQVARIVRLNASGSWEGIVGNAITNKPLVALVTTADGVPVSGAPVTFRRLTGAVDQPQVSAAQAGAAAGDTFTTSTDLNGYAYAWATPDTVILREGGATAILVRPSATAPFEQLIGWNHLTAETCAPSPCAGTSTRVALAFPFEILGSPDAIHSVAVTTGVDRGLPALDLNGTLRARVRDRYDNRIANQLVTWTSAPGGGRFVRSTDTRANEVLILNLFDARQLVSLSAPSSTLGAVEATWITAPNPGPYDLLAQTGGVTGVKTVFVEAVDSTTEFTSALGFARRESWNGNVGLSFPSPVTVTVLRAVSGGGGGVTWIPVTGREPDIAKVEVLHRTYNLLDGRELRREKSSPSDTSPGPVAPFRDRVSTPFWPQYEVENALQAEVFSAEAFQWRIIGGTRTKVRVCCLEPGTAQDQLQVLGVASFQVEVIPVRQPIGGAVERVPSGLAEVDDATAGFLISSGSSEKTWARITQFPNTLGQALIHIPDATLWPRHPSDPTLLELRPLLGTQLQFAVLDSAGGTLVAEVFGTEPTTGALKSLQTTASSNLRLELRPPDVSLSARALTPTRIVLPVRNFVSAATPPANALASPNATEPPIVTPGRVAIAANASGQLLVKEGMRVVAEYDLVAGITGVSAFTVVSGLTPEIDSFTHELELYMDATRVGPVNLDITLTPPLITGKPAQTVSVTVESQVDDMGALPVGHVFVKDVSVVDGHLVKQGEDVRVPGRGPALAFAHSYTNRGFTEGQLGQGWSHSFETEVIQTAMGGQPRLTVVGGEGTGQAFRCTAPPTPPDGGVLTLSSCTTQVGYHGTLKTEAVPTTQSDGGVGPNEVQVVYRARGGTTWRYHHVTSEAGVLHYRLRSVTDTRGNVEDFEYATIGAQDLYRVWEAGNTRFLQLQFGAPPPGQTQRRLQAIRLFANPSAPQRLAPSVSGTFLDVCVSYVTDAQGVRSITRYDGDCGGTGTPARSETFQYSTSTRSAAKNNLVSATDPDNITTEYEYYSPTDPLPGEGAFTLFGDKEERIKAVLEPGASATPYRTGFTFSLVTTPLASSSGTAVLNVYNTSVSSPRPGVPATKYFQEGYGTTGHVERPLDATTTATTRVEWDPVHVKPTLEDDARGRVTRSKYDAFGNLIERRVEVTALPASGAGPATQAVVDATGAAVSVVVQKWTYDGAFAKPTCEMDTEGRVTVTVLDSNGAPPASVTGTGLVLRTTRKAAVLSRTQVEGPADCATLAATLPVSPADETTQFRYCGINGACVPLAVRGDLVETLDPEGHSTKVLEYDATGLPSKTAQFSSSGAAIVTTTVVHDARSRVVTMTDTRGRNVEQRWDALDRPSCEARNNARGGSPGLLTLRTFYPGGTPQTEARGSGTCDVPTPLATRTTVLDGRGRPESTTDTGVLLSSITTTVAYDEANNRVSVTDGRGVRTTNAFDFADRVTATTVDVDTANTALFAAEGGEGAGPFSTAQFGYDAVGNKVFAKDLHGYRTDFTLDSLYRTVGTKLPEVPGARLASSPVQYETTRRFDLVGNLVREEDGNHNATLRSYDFANRLLEVTDAVGRKEVSTWDRDGNRRTQENLTGTTRQLRRTFSYDELHRPLDSSEVVTTSSGTLTYNRSTRYDDTASGHAVASRDARGFVTTTLLDDVERPYRVTVDDGAASLLSRQPDDLRAGPALALSTHAEFDALGNSSAVIDARGVRTESTFDALGRVKSRQHPLGITEAWTYDATGSVISMTDRRGVVHQMRFDALGREKRTLLLETVSGSGALTTLIRTYVDTPDSEGRWTIEETDAANSTTRRFMDALGRTVTTRDALGFETQARFDFSAVTARESRDAKGFVTQVDTDAVYRPTAVREFEPGASGPTYSKTTTYDDAARTEVTNDWRGTPTTLSRDGLGRLVRRTRGSGALTQTDTSVFNAGGQEVLHTDANNHQVQWVYDGAGRKVQETKGFGSTVAATWRSTFDAASNVTEVKGPRDTGVSFDVRTTYDALNRATRLEDANFHVTFKAYDSGGLLLCQKTPAGDSGGSYAHGATPTASGETAAACTGTHVTKWLYDEAGQLLSVTTPSDFVTTYVWDASRKRLLAKQDANQNLTSYAYDARHQRTAEFQHLDAHVRLTPLDRDTIPLFEAANLGTQTGTLRWSTSYDANGNAQTRIDALGQTSTEVHGLRNRLDSVSYSLHQTPRVMPSLDSESLAYDENGNVTAVTQQKQTASGVVTEVTSRTYDVLDRLETETRYDTKLTRYGYDRKGNKTSVTDFQNVATTYTFDALDRLETTVTAEGTTASTYFADSLPKTTAFFNGLHESRCYDAAGRLVKLTTGRASAAANPCTPASVVTQYSYAFDAEGNRLSQDEVLTPTGSATPGAAERTEYGYDEDSRLIGVKYPEGTVALYQLDSVGNRVGERKAPASAVVALTAAAFLLVPTSALSNDVVASFNRIDTLQTVTDSVQPSRNASFTWDEAGNLKVQQTAARDRRFDWDIKQTLTRVSDNGIEAGRYDYGSNGLRNKRVTALESVEYVLDGDEVLLEANGSTPTHPATRRYTYGASALAVTDINGSTRTTRALHLDGLGSPGTETNTTAAVTQNRQYDAWGAYRNGTAPTETQPKLGFTGHQYDVETGLTYARARYYDAEYGRFLSRDEAPGDTSNPPSLHKYVYAHSNPLRYTDRSGRFIDPISNALLVYSNFKAMQCADGNTGACAQQSARENAKNLAGNVAAPFREKAAELAEAGHPTAAGALATTGDVLGVGISMGPGLTLRPDDAAKAVVTLPSRLAAAGAACDVSNPDPIACSGFAGVAGETLLTAAAAGSAMKSFAPGKGVVDVGLHQELGRAAPPVASVAAESFSLVDNVLADLRSVVQLDTGQASMFAPPLRLRGATYTTKLINGDFVEVPEGMPSPLLVRPAAPRPATQQPQGGNGQILATGEGATSAEIAASSGGPTGGQRGYAQSQARAQLLQQAADANPGPDPTVYRCWRCGTTSTNASDMHVGHRNVPKSQNGNLSPENVCLEGAACNLSTGNREAPTPGMSCAERGGCGAPYK